METLELGGQPFIAGTKDKFTIATRTTPTRLIWPMLGIALALVSQLAAIGWAMVQSWSFWAWVALAGFQAFILQLFISSIKTLTSGHCVLLHVDRATGSANIERRYIGRSRTEPIGLADIQSLHVHQVLLSDSLPTLLARLDDRTLDLGSLSAMVDTSSAVEILARAQKLSGLPWSWDKLECNPQLDLEQSQIDLTVHTTHDPSAPPAVRGFLLAILVAIFAGIGVLVTEGNLRLAMAAALSVTIIPFSIEYLRARERWKVRSVRLDRAAPHLTMTENRRGGAEVRTSQVPLTDVTGFEVKPPANESPGELQLMLRDGRRIVVLQSIITVELEEAADRLKSRLGLPVSPR